MCPVISTELRLLLWIQEYLSHPILDNFFILVTKLGDAGLPMDFNRSILFITKETPYPRTTYHPFPSC